MNTSRETAIRNAADRLAAARAAKRPVEPVRGILPQGDVDAAYAVQQINIARLVEQGHHRVGRKIGLTSRAVQDQLGVDQPDFGVLLDFMDCSCTTVSIANLIAPRIEAEIAFRIAHRIDRKGLSREELIAHIDSAAAAIEIVDSAIESWDISIVDTIADNASSGLFAVGNWHSYSTNSHLVSARMQMRLNGKEVSSGEGSATLGDPVNALAWLAEVAVEREDPLAAGEVVLAGALGPMTQMSAGQYVVAIDGFPLLSLEVQP